MGIAEHFSQFVQELLSPLVCFMGTSRQKVTGAQHIAWVAPGKL